jgi:putative inorganic carbon (HCO3(-)) transporter
MKASEATASGRRSRTRAMGAAAIPQLPVYVFVAFIIVTFGNLPSRYEFIGILRPTVIFIVLLVVLALVYWQQVSRNLAGPATRWLWILLLYILISLPLVEWPGSVINKNLEVLLKGVVFYFFTVFFVDNPQRLRLVLLAFLCTQMWRVLEPVWLHVTQGYWGSATFMGADDMMDRLSGAPSDSINPNGLAFVIVTVLPFVHFWARQRADFKSWLVYGAVGGLLVYALVLSSSRSGMLALAIEICCFIFFAKRRALFAGLVTGIVVLTIPTLSSDQLQRYQSLYRSDVAGAGTAHGRIEGIESDLIVVRRHPLFGHGLGTSQEANFNAGSGTNYSHNLYTESLIELGFFGTVIIVGFLIAVWRLTVRALRLSRQAVAQQKEVDVTLQWAPFAVMSWVVMALLFNLASYGISEYHWYFFGGLALVLARMLEGVVTPVDPKTPARRGARRGYPRG